MVQKIKNPNFPGIQFEWHPFTGKVYQFRLPAKQGEKVNAFVIAEHCKDHGQAFGFVQTWCRGFRAGQKVPDSNVLLIGAV